MQKELKEELVEHLVEYLEGHQDMYACDIVTNAFKNDYIIYYSRADKWLEKYGSHKTIGREVVEYDTLHFGTGQIDYFDSEKLVHRYARMNCEEIIADSKIAIDNWNNRLSECSKDELIYELKQMI